MTDRDAVTAHFDERARTWDDDPAKVRRSNTTAAAILAAVPTDRSTRLLEYGAGTGLVSQALAPHVGPVTVAEPSAGMRSVMADKVAAGVLPAGTRIWDLDLTVDPPPDERFDLVATALVLHHIIDLTPVLSGFAACLADGGHVAIVDLETEDGSFHDDPTFDVRHGFGREELMAALEDAGFVDVTWERSDTLEKHGKDYAVFLATARKG